MTFSSWVKDPQELRKIKGSFTESSVLHFTHELGMDGALSFLVIYVKTKDVHL